MTDLPDWEADPRPFAECLKAWEAAHKWSSAEAARQMRAPYLTYRAWRDGRRQPSPPGTVRLLMTLIDRELASDADAVHELEALIGRAAGIT